jgi:hypothetical protein
MKIRFLLDENLSPRLIRALHRLNPAIDVLRVGQDGAPPLGTADPDLLRHLEITQLLLVTDNRTSMPEHLQEYWAQGGHLWGLVWIRPGTSLGRLAQELHLIWDASEAEEWLDRVEWVPF